ncbi:MAG: rRNA pseudouridine synthase [Candidatus Taylorbacteria bacterium]|nr:rRNA pseudouridine synthase [Candidatus Taylorbacteria bacterium]
MHRLDQLLASLGYSSRSEARDLLKAGLVTVKGEEASDPSLRAKASDVLFDGEPLDHPDGILIAFNKPLGVVCTRSSSEGQTIYEFLPEQWLRRNPEVSTVGRLDKDTEGLILLTDRGDLLHRLASPKGRVPKVYRVFVDKDLSDGLVGIFKGGTLLLEGEKDPCAPADFRILGPREAELILYEGRNRQVRRMFASQGYMVQSLKRERIGPLELGDIKPGEWRDLPLDYFDK